MTSCRLPRVGEAANGVPWRSTITWCLDPGGRRSTGEGRREPSFNALTWGPSIAESSMSRQAHCLKLDQQHSCRWGQTPARVWLGFCQDGGTWGHVVQHGQVCRREEPPTVITGEGHWEWEGGTGRYAGCYP